MRHKKNQKLITAVVLYGEVGATSPPDIIDQLLINVGLPTEWALARGTNLNEKMIRD